MKGLTLLLVLCAVLVQGCVAVPVDSDVHLVQQDGGLGESTAHYTPARPATGASPSEHVRGFVDAMLAYPVTWSIASEFLTTTAARNWQPTVRTVIYSAIEVESEGAAVWLNVHVDAELDQQGRRTPVGEDRRIEVPMELVDGQWRISEAPAGNLMSAGFATKYLRPFDLYFLDPTLARVVAEPVHAVVGDQLATSLMTALSWGPVGPSAEVQATVVPPVSDLRASVPVVDHVAEVQFSTRLNDLESIARARLSAQVVWTLGQVPGVSAVRIFGGTGVLSMDGTTVQPIGTWHSFGSGPARAVHAVAQGGVFALDAHEATPAPWAEDVANARYVTQSRAGIVSVTDTLATITGRDDDEVQQIRGSGFLAPILDVADRVWLIDAPRGVTRVRVLDDGARVTVRPQGRFAEWTSLAISPDGSRWAATDVEGNLQHGIVRIGKDRLVLEALSSLSSGGEHARSVQWLDGSSLLYLVEGQQHVRHSRIDGSRQLVWWPEVSVRLPDATIRELLVVHGVQPQVYLVDVNDELWVLEPSRWRRVALDDVLGIS